MSKYVLLSLVGIAFLIAAVYAALRIAGSPPVGLGGISAPSDGELRATFKAHLRELEELRDILLAIPQHNVHFGEGQIGGDLPRGPGYIAFFNREGRWHEWESARPVPLAEILQSLGLRPDQHSRVMEIVRNVGASSVRKDTWPHRVAVAVDVHRAGVLGISKDIVFVDPEPSRDIVPSTDSDQWDGVAYAPLGRDGWYICATR